MTEEEARAESLRALGIEDEFDHISIRSIMEDMGEFTWPPTLEQEQHLIRLGALVWPAIEKQL